MPLQSKCQESIHAHPHNHYFFSTRGRKRIFVMLLLYTVPVSSYVWISPPKISLNFIPVAFISDWQGWF